jgi:hypothetical protein
MAAAAAAAAAVVTMWGNAAANNAGLLCNRALARSRGIRRFNALLQRIEHCGIRTALGDAGWKIFVGFVRRHFRPAFLLRLFAPTNDALRCCGTLDGDRCPHRFTVNFAATQSIKFTPPRPRVQRAPHTSARLGWA